MRRTPQTVVTHFVDTGRQYMLEKTSDELLSADGHGFGLSAAGTLTSKGHLSILGREDSVVGDGDPVNVAGQVIEDCGGALNGRFTMDDPVLLPKGFRRVKVLILPANTVEDVAAKHPG